MTVYCLARITALLYGIAWPINANAMAVLAVVSFFTLPIEIVVVSSMICATINELIKKEGK